MPPKEKEERRMKETEVVYVEPEKPETKPIAT